MKKIAIIAIIIAVAVLVSAGYYLKSKKETSNDQTQQIDLKQNVIPSENEKVGKSGGTLTDELKGIFATGNKMKCVYKVKNEGQTDEITVYVDGEKYRTETNMNGMKNYAVFDGEYFYSWMEGTEQGTKMSVRCMEDLGGEAAGDEDKDTGEFEADSFKYQSPTEMAEDALNVDCQPIGSVDLSIPDDIEFADQCEMLKNQMKALENLQNQMPVDMPSDLDAQ